MVSKLILIAPTWQGPLRVMGLPTVVRNGAPINYDKVGQTWTKYPLFFRVK